MFKKRKAQGLSITTIIVAVIGIIILVVLIVIFTGRLGIFSKGLEEQSDVKCTNICRALNMDEGTTLTSTTTVCGTGETKVSEKCCCKSKGT
jgi:hypothetical protein